MTQPPEERDPLANKPPEPPDAPEDQPTVAWTPGGSSSEPPPIEPSTAGAPPPSDASMPPAGEPPRPETPPASPIISASPAAAPTEPSAWPAPAPAAPVVAWETPGAVAAAGQEGYVIAGMGARLVAFLLDNVIVGVIPAILSLLVIDWAGLFDQLAAASATPTTTTAFTMAITPQLILVTLIQLAIQFIYFVGFWTSGGHATLGMRGLKMQAVDAATGATLSLTAATKRFVALGYPLALLSLVPGLQSIAGILPFALLLFLFFTAVTNERRQGLHDKWANSLVIRSTTSGDGATVIGCLVLIVIIVGIGIIASAALFAAIAPQMDDFIRAMESARPVAP
jgi:uncharacterized RDD family membrane protein YckC